MRRKILWTLVVVIAAGLGVTACGGAAPAHPPINVLQWDQGSWDTGNWE